MENSNFKKQAKSDIFKELLPIISFYIKKGAKPQSLKKYYKNNKRFNDILEDIRNKGINLVKDETEYKNLVREILNEILDDFIAKQKDEDYKNKKLKHIKEFYSFEINEDLSTFQHILLSTGAAFCVYKFVKGLYNDIKQQKFQDKYIAMSPQERDELKNEMGKKLIDVNYRILTRFTQKYFKDGGEIKFSEDYLFYIFELGDLMIKIDKRNKTIKWSNIEIVGPLAKFEVPNKEEFTESFSISQEEIDELITSLKEENNN
jgi:hypothetical protein